MRPLHGLFVLLAFGCGRETFDLLPPEEETESMAGNAGGPPFGTGGNGGSAGSGFPTGGRGGREEPPPPIPDCPEYVTECRPCTSSHECDIGTFCDRFRNYCAPYCDGAQWECFQPPVCDTFRSVCVECTINSHCRGALEECEGGKCVPGTAPECFSNSQCEDPAEPVCIEGECRSCFSNSQCGPDMQCIMGRCEPDLPGPGP